MRLFFLFKYTQLRWLKTQNVSFKIRECEFKSFQPKRKIILQLLSQFTKLLCTSSLPQSMSFEQKNLCPVPILQSSFNKLQRGAICDCTIIPSNNFTPLVDAKKENIVNDQHLSPNCRHVRWLGLVCGVDLLLYTYLNMINGTQQYIINTQC